MNHATRVPATRPSCGPCPPAPVVCWKAAPGNDNLWRPPRACHWPLSPTRFPRPVRRQGISRVRWCRAAPPIRSSATLRGGVVSPLHGPWPAVCAKAPFIRAGWRSFWRRELFPVWPRDAYFAEQVAACSKACGPAHACGAGMLGRLRRVPAPNSQTCRRLCAALERLAKGRSRTDGLKSPPPRQRRLRPPPVVDAAPA